MIRSALRAKLRARGAIRFAEDAAIMVGQLAYFGSLFGAGLVVATVVGLPVLAVDKAIRWATGERCGVGCASGAVSCGHTPPACEPGCVVGILGHSGLCDTAERGDQ